MRYRFLTRSLLDTVGGMLDANHVVLDCSGFEFHLHKNLFIPQVTICGEYHACTKITTEVLLMFFL